MMKTQTLTQHKNSSPRTFLGQHIHIRNDSKVVQRCCYISTQFLLHMVACLLEWNSLKTQSKIEMTLLKKYTSN